MINPIQLINIGDNHWYVIYGNTLKGVSIDTPRELSHWEGEFGKQGFWKISDHPNIQAKHDPSLYIERDELDMLILLGEYDAK